MRNGTSFLIRNFSLFEGKRVSRQINIPTKDSFVSQQEKFCSEKSMLKSIVLENANHGKDIRGKINVCFNVIMSMI